MLFVSSYPSSPVYLYTALSDSYYTLQTKHKLIVWLGLSQQTVCIQSEKLIFKSNVFHHWKQMAKMKQFLID